MTTYADVIRAAIPGATESDMDFVLWGRTPYPVGGITAKSLYHAASAWHRASANGLQLCDWCHRPAQPNRSLCARCDKTLHPEAA